MVSITIIIVYHYNIYTLHMAAYHKLNMHVTLRERLLHACAVGDLQQLKSIGFEGIAENRSARNADYQTALIVASRYGHFNIVLELVLNGYDVNELGNFEETCMHWACRNGHIRIVRYLASLEDHLLETLMHPSSPDFPETSLTPLTIAGDFQQIEVCKYLLGVGVLPDMKSWEHDDFDGPETAGGELIQNISSDIWNDFIFQWACYQNDVFELNFILNNPAIKEFINFTISARGSWTALHVCSFFDRVEAAEILIANGVDLYLVTSDNCGLTALQLACNRGNVRMVDMLLKAMGTTRDVTAHDTFSVAYSAMKKRREA